MLHWSPWTCKNAHTDTQVRVIRSHRVSHVLHHWVIHLECIHVYKAFPTWTQANQSASTSHCQIYQFTGRLQTGKYWDMVSVVDWICVKAWCSGGVCFFLFYFTGWESLSETVAKTEWWDVLRQQWWLYRIHTHTWAYAHINIAARACGRRIYAWGHSLVHAWTYKCMWICGHT